MRINQQKCFTSKWKNSRNAHIH